MITRICWNSSMKMACTDQTNYEYIQTKMDVENFIDYTASEIYSANTDWPHNNVKILEVKSGQYNPDALPGQDGRWRWMLFDTDLGFGLNQSWQLCFIEHWKLLLNDDNKGFLLSSLLANEEFKIQFINRTADHLNSSFKEKRVLETNRPDAGCSPARKWRNISGAGEAMRRFCRWHGKKM